MSSTTAKSKTECMRKTVLAAFAVILCLSIMIIDSGAAMSKNSVYAKVRISSEGREAIIALYDNPVSRDFASLLPLDVTFENYAKTEKITYLPRKLTTSGGISGSQAQGDFTYYAPWGNLAVFYKGYGQAAGLYILGTIESGKEWLGERPATFPARMELMENS